ncbi:hypothetical protein BJY01DRAFT_227281 [Aspergillus pseudoustus]|uniref:Transmembrane protein n=1 Tax=Aspergillus pseudoustus TaxID=1810923 RepID=A0ABR4IRI4_9EURO
MAESSSRTSNSEQPQPKVHMVRTVYYTNFIHYPTAISILPFLVHDSTMKDISWLCFETRCVLWAS